MLLATTAGALALPPAARAPLASTCPLQPSFPNLAPNPEPLAAPTSHTPDTHAHYFHPSRLPAEEDHPPSKRLIPVVVVHPGKDFHMAYELDEFANPVSQGHCVQLLAERAAAGDGSGGGSITAAAPVGCAVRDVLPGAGCEEQQLGGSGSGSSNAAESAEGVTSSGGGSSSGSNGGGGGGAGGVPEGPVDDAAAPQGRCEMVVVEVVVHSDCEEEEPGSPM